ncbi:MAG TPA: serine--tRNA ligase, partial [Nautiliaceae bacterium]|nr:serine--tRNA ligase [Nautiliaceae bacterium]
MLDIKFIRENKEKVEKAILNKGVRFDLSRLLEIDEERRRLIKIIEEKKAKQNQLTKEIAQVQDSQEKEKKLMEVKKIKEEIKKIEPELKNTEKAFKKLLLLVPNIPKEDVKIGKDETENEIIKKVGKPKNFNFPIKNYIELGKIHHLIDTERAAKISGSRFGYLKNQVVLLQFALIQFVLETLTSEKFLKKIIKKNNLKVPSKIFQPIIPPVMIKEK